MLKFDIVSCDINAIESNGSPDVLLCSCFCLSLLLWKYLGNSIGLVAV